jgi:hypothetical protein
MVLGGASAGLILHLSRHFALALDGRVLTGLPNWGAVVEAGLSVQLAFGGVKGPAVTEDEEEVISGEDGGPPPDEPPTTDLGYEEE